jgi:dipeptidase E
VDAVLILTSNGISSESMMKSIEPHFTGLSKAIIVTTASVEYKDNDWHIPRLKDELYALGLSVDYFDFDFDAPRKLLQYDVIEIIGGNPFYLLKSMKKSNCERVLEELSKFKILIGISAGSLVLQNNIELIAQYSPEMNQEVNITDFTGFHLTDIEILPHYSKFLSRFERFEERAREYEEKGQHKIIRLNDGQGILIDEDRYILI